jgi:IS30 family transposase
VGPLPQGKGGVRFVVVTVDYFTKWVEVEHLVNITAKSIERFLWKNVVCRYGVSHALITDNGKQFDCEPFRKWCNELHIRNYFSSLGHPQANGQVEAANKTIFKILKKKLGDREKRLGRRSPRSSLGILNYEKDSYGRNPLRSSVQN